MYLIESDRPADERLVDVLLGVLRTEEAVLQTVYRGQAAEWVPARGRGRVLLLVEGGRVQVLVTGGRVQVLGARGCVRLGFEAEHNLRIFP